MPREPKQPIPKRLVQEWALSSSATLGSAVRAKGILQEVRAGLSLLSRKHVALEGGSLVLRVPEDDSDAYSHVIDIVTEALAGIEVLPVIPREVEDILSITSVERHRWLRDGRLQSAGTRTVKLRGRARKITFHVFDPHHIEDLLDRDMPSLWREQDVLAAAENRRRAAGKAALTRAAKRAKKKATTTGSTNPSPKLEGWEEFDLDGLLR
jgi:hypothetical protein